jgi:DNA polymerase/3'-5' exonuclease PolX
VTKSRIPLDIARGWAERLRSTLLAEADAFSRLEVAGSIRRGKQEVGDIELVGELDSDRIFGATSRVKYALAVAGVGRADPITRADGVTLQAPWADRYLKGAASFARAGGPAVDIQLDLFIVHSPAEWGVVYLIRTGSAEFSRAMVTRLHRFALRADQGAIFDTSRPDWKTNVAAARVPCPDETTFFRLARIPVVPPEERDMNYGPTARLFDVAPCDPVPRDAVLPKLKD